MSKNNIRNSSVRITYVVFANLYILFKTKMLIEFYFERLIYGVDMVHKTFMKQKQTCFYIKQKFCRSSFIIYIRGDCDIPIICTNFSSQ